MLRNYQWILISAFCLFATFSFGCDSDDDDDDSDDGDPSFTDDDDDKDDDTDDDDDGVDDDDDDASPPPYPESCTSDSVFSFDLDSTIKKVPYPNNIYRLPDPASPTGHRLNVTETTASPMGFYAHIKVLSFLFDAYNELNGFSTTGDLFMPVGQYPVATQMTHETLPAVTDGILLFVNDPDSPFDGQLVPMSSDWPLYHGCMRMTPQFPLLENTRYALVGTRRMHPEGSCFKASQSMQQIWSDWAVGDTGADYYSALSKLNEMGVDPAEVLSIAEFDTGIVTADLQKAKVVIDDLADSGPGLFYDWDVVPDSDPALFATAHATFNVPTFLSANGTWNFDSLGVPVVDHYQPVRAYFTIPDENAHPDGQPYPILIFEHGLFNDKEEMRPPFTTEAAANGFAMVGIDALCHGERMPPGFTDLDQILCFYDVAHPQSMRDKLRENITSLLWLAQSLKSLEGLDLDDNGIPDFDTDRIYNMGASFGSILAGNFAALDTTVDAHVLAASGAKIGAVIYYGEAWEYLKPIEMLEDQFVPDFTLTDDVKLIVFGFLQAILDPADSVNFAPHITANPFPVVNGHTSQVLQQGSSQDDVIGYVAGGWLCRAGGWPQVRPRYWSAGMGVVDAPYSGSGYFHFNTDDHTLLFDSHPTGVAAREQVLHFLRTHLDDGVGEIINPFAKDK